jgi:hypothetical protein
MNVYRNKYFVDKSSCNIKRNINSQHFANYRKIDEGGNISEDERKELEAESERQLDLIQQLSPAEISQDGKTLEESLFSDDIKAMCKEECNMCKKPVRTLRNHVQECHKMSFKEFRKLHPEEVFAVKTYHR